MTPRFNRPRFDEPSGPVVSAVVKWFKPEKGFGFVELSDGSGDAFLHATVLGRGGVTAVQPGDTLILRYKLQEEIINFSLVAFFTYGIQRLLQETTN